MQLQQSYGSESKYCRIRIFFCSRIDPDLKVDNAYKILPQFWILFLNSILNSILNKKGSGSVTAL